MANFTTIATRRRWYNGECGNLSISPTLQATLASNASGEVITLGDKIEPNIKIVAVHLTSAALGASTTLTLKVGSTTLVNAQSTASAVNQNIPVDDVVTGNDLITLTVGGGTASGLVKFKFIYEVVGNL